MTHDNVTGAVFDVTADLPAGTTVLEASAGTGKTYAIAALATRYIAEGLARLDDLLLVTFSRAATRELRDRVRRALTNAERVLADPDRHDGSALHSVLLTGSPDDLADRRTRLATAVAGFDAATIETTHSFCLRMLSGLGVAGSHDPQARLSENLDDLLHQSVDDLYLARYAGGVPPFPPDVARELGRQIVGQPLALLEPALAPADSVDAERVRFARAVLAEFETRTLRARVLSFDDLQLRLRDSLLDPATGPRAAALLGERFRVVLVDEFQDTDPVQWDILRLAFHGRSRLVLIGDPKQAIYAFRGGDIATYLRASEAADHHRVLDVNWRSDAGVVSGLHDLLGGLALGDPRIVVRPVRAHHVEPRLIGAGAPVRLRRLRRDGLATSQGGRPVIGAVRRAIAADLAADLAGLLAAPAQVLADGSQRPLSAGDVAVLVAKHSQAEIVREALNAKGIATVLTAGTSVFGSPAAADWTVLLEALDSPHRSSPVKALAISRFVGWSGTRLAQADDEHLDWLTGRVRVWARLIERRGVAAVLESITETTDLAGRLLAAPGGERELTDLRHIGEALHEVARTEHLGLAGLRAWLRERTQTVGVDADQTRNRRLASDAHAVTVATVHAAKGLEFPLVYVPFAADRHVPDAPDTLRFNDVDGRRVIDLGSGAAPGHAERKARHRRAADDEDLRLLYVALTRGASQVVSWWAPSTTVQASALHRVLFGHRTADGELPATVALASDAQAQEVLERLAAASAGAIAVEVVAGAGPAAVEPVRTGPAFEPADLRVRTWTRQLDVDWRRTSYSGLTAAAHDAHVAASEPDLRVLDDEPEQSPDPLAAPAGPGPSAHGPLSPADSVGHSDSDSTRDEVRDFEAARRQARALPSPWNALAAGAAFGTVVHEVLERLDPGQGDLETRLLDECRRVVVHEGARIDPVDLAAALEPTLRTPLDPVLPGLALADIPAADRLVEVTFELPLAGGDRQLSHRGSPPRQAAVLADLAALLAERLPADDPLASYPHRLLGPAMPTTALRGYLTGSIDAVLRVGTGDDARYVVVDYKTNRLPAADSDRLTAWDYRPHALATAMMDAHYPLQALLYSVALHRFLRWRQPRYDPGRHLGGVAYLFLRGMCGAQTPLLGGSRCGVFGWQPAPELIEATSDLLAGRS